jgi:hypothetical protein
VNGPATIISGNVISGVGSNANQSGIKFATISHLTISNNTILVAASQTAIECSASGTTKKKIVIVNNTLLGSSSYTGYDGDYAQDLIFCGNTVDGFNFGVTFQHTTKFVCSNNIIDNCALRGLYALSTSSKGIIVNNVIDLSGGSSTGLLEYSGAILGPNQVTANTLFDFDTTCGYTRTLTNTGTPAIGRSNASYGCTWKTGGTTTITNFTGAQDGDLITILANHTVTITHGSSTIVLQGATNFGMVSTNTLTLKFDGTRWNEIGRHT